MFLFETLLRPRYYLASTAVDWRFLSESPTTTFCPYKGKAKYVCSYLTLSHAGRFFRKGSRCFWKGRVDSVADAGSYYNITVNGKEMKDAVWYYKYPTAESGMIAGRLCFYNEKVDVFVDGVKEDKQGGS